MADISQRHLKLFVAILVTMYTINVHLYGGLDCYSFDQRNKDTFLRRNFMSITFLIVDSKHGESHIACMCSLSVPEW